jgi:hypothetical protein
VRQTAPSVCDEKEKIEGKNDPYESTFRLYYAPPAESATAKYLG